MREIHTVFVFGPMAVGKSTLLEKVKDDSQITSIYKICDMDENGVPAAGRKFWRRYRVEEMIHQAHLNALEKRSTIVFGVCFPEEILSAEYYDKKKSNKFIHLDCSNDLLFKRIRERISKIGTTDNSRTLHKTNISWADNFRSNSHILGSVSILNTSDKNSDEIFIEFKKKLLE